MRKEDTYPFLLRVAIPEVRERRKLPTRASEPNLIWDAIYRAHRDVLTGRQYVAEYSKERGPYGGQPGKGVNRVAEDLYNMVIELNSGELITSAGAIAQLSKRFPNVKLGAIQKLVNMSLKYLVILQTFGLIGAYVDEAKCDCPIDSVILAKLAKSHPEFAGIKWTSIEAPEVYERIQQAIDHEPGIRTRLMYDFKNWQ